MEDPAQHRESAEMPSADGAAQRRQTAADLLHRAEARMGDKPMHGAMGTEDNARLLHELGVHQIELEMQNDQLRQAQAALEASRDRYRDLYEQAPIGYVSLNLDGLIAEANTLAVKLLGQPRSRLTGRPLIDFVAPEDRALLQRRPADLVRAEGPTSVEVRVASRQRDKVWLSMQMALVPEDSGHGPQCRVALIDITERVQMQEGVARLAAIVASSDDAIISRDLDGRITSWNEGATRLFDATADEMLRNTMDALVPLDRRDEEHDMLLRLARGEKLAHVETERLMRGGMRIPVSMSLSPVRGERGAVVGSALIARDITERRRSERALRERMRQLDVLPQAGHALILGDQQASDMRSDLFERVRAAVGCEIYLDYQLLEDPADEPGAVPKALRLASSHGLTDVQRNGMARVLVADSPCGHAASSRRSLVINQLQHSTQPSLQRLRAAGARCYAGFPLLAHGRLYGVAAFASTSHDQMRDSDLQVIQTVCDQVSAMLERRELLDELHAREETLKQADRAKDNFIATLAHELRNPLAPIRNAVTLLRRGDVRNVKQLDWCRDIIERQVVQMTHLLEDLLDVSRLTRNKIELRREPISLQQAIAQALESTQSLLESRSHRLTLDLPDEPLELQADLTRLTQVFTNLLNNAAKYTDAGGQIWLTARREDLGGQPHACVRVRDSGIGIEAHKLREVFDMFAQLEPALRRAGGGLGIGLALTRGLVALHGGTVEAYSEGKDRGSEFVVRLPLRKALQTGFPASVSAPLEDPRPRRLLVVDDNVDSAQTLSAMLSEHGQQVRTAFGGLDGLRIAQEWHPEAAVLDIGMEDLDGYELCRRIREQPWGEEPLLIACTGWGQDEDKRLARAAGFDYHLVKPVDLDAVLRLLSGERPRHGH